MLFSHEVGVWHEGGHAYAIPGQRQGWVAFAKSPSSMREFEGGFASCYPTEMNCWCRKNENGLLWCTGRSGQTIIQVFTSEH